MVIIPAVLPVLDMKYNDYIGTYVVMENHEKMRKLLTRMIALFLAIQIIPAFADSKIVLPEDLRIIGVEAFEGLRAEEVVLPDGIERIEARAFKDSSIQKIEMPASLSYIALDAFEGCDGLTATFEKPDTYAQQYCDVNDITNYVDSTDYFTLTLDADGGEVSQSIIKVIKGQPIGSLPIPTRENCTFSKWRDFQGLPVTSSTVLTSDKTIWAQWIRNAYKVTFVTGPGQPPITQTVAKGDKAIQPEDPISPTGNTFLGWYSDGSQFDFSKTVSGDKDIIISARWSDSTQFEFEYISSTDSYRFANFTGGDIFRSVNIPDTYEGKPVTAIGSNAFRSGTNNIVKVIIPNSVTTIENNAFSYIYTLKTFEIPDSVTSIGNSAFYHCSVTSVTIPGSVRFIGSSAFRHCLSLEEVIISEGVEYIGSRAFGECPKLTSINIPKSVKSCGERPFVDSSLTSATIAEGATKVSDNLFSYCKALTSVTIPDSVRIIGNRSFENCNNLIHIDLPEGIVEIGVLAFWRCSSLSEIELPSGITSIGEQAFYECVAINDLPLPGNLRIIGDYAFYGCTGLTYMVIPDGVMSLPQRVFCECTSLKRVSIPESVQSIGIAAFMGCSALEEMILPNGVTSINNLAFQGCTNMRSIYISSNLSTIGHDVWINCDSLTKAIIADGTIRIASDLFSGCTHLNDITIPFSVEVIGEYAFYGCNALMDISLSNNVREIERYAFGRCSGLTEITIPNSVTSIGTHAFDGCSNLTHVTVSNSVSSAGDYIFTNCSSLNYATVAKGATAIPNYLFSHSESLLSVSLPDSLQRIGSYAFAYCSSLASIEIPECVNYIGSCAFTSCSQLGTVTIPQRVPSIESYTFSNCTNLFTATIRGTETKIGSSTFSYSGLQTLYIPEDYSKVKDITKYYPSVNIEYINSIGDSIAWPNVTVSFSNIRQIAHNKTQVTVHVSISKPSDSGTQDAPVYLTNPYVSFEMPECVAHALNMADPSHSNYLYINPENSFTGVYLPELSGKYGSTTYDAVFYYYKKDDNSFQFDHEIRAVVGCDEACTTVSDPVSLPFGKEYGYIVVSNEIAMSPAGSAVKRDTVPKIRTLFTQSHYIIDEIGYNFGATYSKFKGTMQAYKNNMNEFDELYIYLFAHGGENNGNPTNSMVLVKAENEADNQVLSNIDFLDMLSAVPGKKTVITDVCYSGTLVNALKNYYEQFPTKYKNITILAAAGKNEEALVSCVIKSSADHWYGTILDSFQFVYSELVGACPTFLEKIYTICSNPSVYNNGFVKLSQLESQITSIGLYGRTATPQYYTTVAEDPCIFSMNVN